MSEELYLIAKAAREKKRKSEYRDSLLAWGNPRSHTQVRRGPGSMARRFGREYGGAAAGGGIGTYIASATSRSGSPRVRAIGRSAPVFGGVVGQSTGRTFNLISGDTRARHRKTKERATGAFSGSQAGLPRVWLYPEKNSRARG